jgi:hypothetical protein
MTAPTKNHFEVDAVSRGDQSGKPMSGVHANNLAAERQTHLLNEIIAKGVLPAL